MARRPWLSYDKCILNDVYWQKQPQHQAGSSTADAVMSDFDQQRHWCFIIILPGSVVQTPFGGKGVLLEPEHCQQDVSCSCHVSRVSADGCDVHVMHNVMPSGVVQT